MKSSDRMSRLERLLCLPANGPIDLDPEDDAILADLVAECEIAEAGHGLSERREAEISQILWGITQRTDAVARETEKVTRLFNGPQGNHGDMSIPGFIASCECSMCVRARG